jgi:hypothetical protein
MPQVSAIMPVYNCAAPLREAVASVAGQTMQDFELIAVNDGSTDESAAVLAELAAGDARIRVLHQDNQGVGAALNRAIAAARAPYLARMDADDRTVPARLAMQLAFMEDHPDIAVVGGQHETFGDGPPRRTDFPQDPARVAATLLLRCCVSHPTVLMRTALFRAQGFAYSVRRGLYPEDYLLWADLVRARQRIANLPDVLLHYRQWLGQATAARPERIADLHLEVQRGLLSLLGLAPDPRQCQLHRALAFGRIAAEPAFLVAAHGWLCTLAEANARCRVFAPDALARVLTGRYVALLRVAAELGRTAYDALRDSPFQRYVEVPVPAPA